MSPRRAFLGVFAATLFAFLGIGAVLPVLPRYVSGPLGGGDVSVGIVMGSFAFTAVVFRPIGGRLSDHRGRRTIVIWGGTLSALAGLLYLLPLDVPGLIFARLVLGIGDGWLYTAGASWVVDITPEERRGEAIGLYGMSIWLGLSFGPPIGEGLRAVGSYELVWLFAAAAPAIGALIAARMPERPPMTSAAPSGRMLPREALLPGLALGCSVIGFAAVQGFVVLMLEERDIGHGAAVFTAFASAVALTRLLFARLPDRLGASRTAAYAAAGHAGGLVVLAAAQGLVAALAGAVIMGIGFSLLFPSLALLVLDRVDEERRGAALGSFTAFFDAGMGVGAPLAGTIAALAGYGPMFLTAAALSLAGAALSVGRARPAATAP